jgi:hypothetical protein
MRCHNDNFVAPKAKLIVAFPNDRPAPGAREGPAKRLLAAKGSLQYFKRRRVIA